LDQSVAPALFPFSQEVAPMPFTVDDYEMLKLADKSAKNSFLRLMASRHQCENGAFLLLEIDYKENTSHKKAQFITQWYINPSAGRPEFAFATDPYNLTANAWSQPINLPNLTPELVNVKRTANYISDRRKYPDLFDPFVNVVLGLLRTQTPPLELDVRSRAPQILAAYETNLINFSQALNVAGFNPEECGVY
jgi:hypothetical protein